MNSGDEATMPAAPDNHNAHDYAKRIRERLPRRLKELRERCGLSKYGLARNSGISREASAGSSAAYLPVHSPSFAL